MSSKNKSRVSNKDILDPGTPFPEPEVRPEIVDAFRILIMGAGAVAGKKAIELFVEQIRNWISRKGVSTQIEVKPPTGTVIESVKVERDKVILTLKPIAELSSQPMASPASKKKKK